LPEFKEELTGQRPTRPDRTIVRSE
jgi:hypothetical protein